MAVAAVIALRFFVFPPVPALPVLGLLDPWMDFRRLRGVGHDENDPEDDDVPEKGDTP